MRQRCNGYRKQYKCVSTRTRSPDRVIWASQFETESYLGDGTDTVLILSILPFSV